MGELTLRRRRQRDEFHRLFDRSPSERAARLVELEQDDSEFAAAVHSLLAHADADCQVDACDIDRASRAVGSIVGERFRLMRLLGRGGMGDVYLAERTDDRKKHVALKIVREGLLLPKSRAQREGQILARLSHPNIAGLIDAGVAEAGQPWFAMDYVDGEYITDWSDHRKLHLSARVRLFAIVCRAVQFAHRNLILHRDLKPSNILVDGEGVPKLLDFGIAKSLDGTDSHQTQTQAFTLAYAAPEQLRGEAASTATDVYQLGLVLYQLLSGVDLRIARGASQRDSVLSSMDEALAIVANRDRCAVREIAMQRSATPSRLRHLLRGDLGRIAVKATADDPCERYETAQAFAEDLDRWADGLPVVAHRGTFGYRAKKYIRRNAGTSCALTLLGLGLVATSAVAFNQALSERVQREHAEQQRKRAETVSAFMRDVFHAADPDETDGAKTDAGELLRRATVKLDGRRDLDDVTRAMLNLELADVWGNLGQPLIGLPVVERVVTALAPIREKYPDEYLRGAAHRVYLLVEAGRYNDAIAAVDSPVLTLARRTPIRSRRWYEPLLIYRGIALMNIGRLDEAEHDLRTALDDYTGDTTSAHDSDLGLALNALASLAAQRGETRRALVLFQREKATLESSSEAGQIDLLINRANIAGTQILLGDADAAATTLVAALARCESWFGADHARTRTIRILLAMAYVALGDDRAAAAAISAVPAEPIELGAALPETYALVQIMRAGLDMRRGHRNSALEMLRAIESAHKAGDAPSRIAVRAATVLGEALLQDGDYARARTHLESAMHDARALYEGRASATVADLEDSLGRTLLVGGDVSGAEVHLRLARDYWIMLQGVDKPSVLRSEIHLLWAQWVQSQDGRLLDQMARKRTALIQAVNGKDVAQIRQAGVLIEELGHASRQPRLRTHSAPSKTAPKQRKHSRSLGLDSFFL